MAKSFKKGAPLPASLEASAPAVALPDDSDLTVSETKDLVKVGPRADVFYSIEDPEKCINKIDTDELEDLVRETEVATLTNIIRSTALNEIARSKQESDITRPRSVRFTLGLPNHSTTKILVRHPFA